MSIWTLFYACLTIINAIYGYHTGTGFYWCMTGVFAIRAINEIIPLRRSS